MSYRPTTTRTPYPAHFKAMRAYLAQARAAFAVGNTAAKVSALAHLQGIMWLMYGGVAEDLAAGLLSRQQAHVILAFLERISGYAQGPCNPLGDHNPT